jgi:hypothetical protein
MLNELDGARLAAATGAVVVTVAYRYDPHFACFLSVAHIPLLLSAIGAMCLVSAPLPALKPTSVYAISRWHSDGFAASLTYGTLFFDPCFSRGTEIGGTP